MIAVEPIATIPIATLAVVIIILPTGLVSDDILFDIVRAAIEQDIIRKDIETDLIRFHIIQRFED